MALASVLGLSPDIWLLDEPSAGLDLRRVAWLLEFTNRQEQAGKTVIPATHDLGILETIAGRVYVRGEEHQLVAEGAPLQILADKALLLSNCLTRPV